MNDKNELKQISDLLQSSKTIAVVGLSDNPGRTSLQIARFMAEKGYKIVGVNPSINKSGSFDVYSSLKEIPFQIDIVNVFRRSETIPEIIDDVAAINPKALWLQQGIRNDEAVKPLIEKGIQTIQDKCIAVYYNLCKAI